MKAATVTLCNEIRQTISSDVAVVSQLKQTMVDNDVNLDGITTMNECVDFLPVLQMNVISKDESCGIQTEYLGDYNDEDQIGEWRVCG